MADALALVDHLFRRQAGQMVATLTRTLGSRHLALAEDAVQDALLTAMQQWPFRGVPDNPQGWLFQVARNRALDRLRHAKVVVDKEAAIKRETAIVEQPPPAPLLLSSWSGEAVKTRSSELRISVNTTPVASDGPLLVTTTV